MKKCSRCLTDKPRTAFHVANNKPDGLQVLCKECKSEVNKIRVTNRRQEWLSKNGPCVDCGSWENLEVDHVDPSTKDPRLRKGSGSVIFTWKAEKREKELAKCVVRCHECHMAKTIKNEENILRGEENNSTNYTSEKVLTAVAMMDKGLKIQEITDILGIPGSTLRGWRSGAKWNHLTKRK
jgi:hypothetical protein